MAAPAELYDAPVNRYVADFVGQSNFFAGQVAEGSATEATLRTERGVAITAPYPEGAVSLEGRAGGNVSPHWMRHAHASHALDRGAAIHLVQATLGHSSVATTGKYLHARPNESSSKYLAV